MMQVLSVAMLSPKLSNRMLVTRLYVLGCWLVTGVVAGVWTYCEDIPVPILIWVIVSGSLLMILTVMALGERDTWTTRVRKTIPRDPLLRCFAFLLYTGSAGGILWWTLMFAATIVLALIAGETVAASEIAHTSRL